MRQMYAVAMVFTAILIIRSNCQIVQCNEILMHNNVYIKSVIKVFNNGYATMVRFGPEDTQLYQINEKVYSIEFEEEYTETFNFVKSSIDIKGVGDLNLNFGKTNIPSSVPYKTDNKFIYALYNDLVFAIKLSGTEESGPLYVVNKKDVNIAGDFIVTKQIKEVGDKVFDVDVNMKTGDVLLSVFNEKTNSGEVLLLKFQPHTLCKENDCSIAENRKDAVKSVLKSVDTKIYEIYKNLLNAPEIKNCAAKEDYEDIENKNIVINSKLNSLKKKISEYKRADNNLYYRKRRSSGNGSDTAHICTTQHSFRDQKETLGEIISEVQINKDLLEKLEKKMEQMKVATKPIETLNVTSTTPYYQP